ncbi:MAG: DNA packaging protein [Firmicutes bacterium]|nr:DNA packaging protein [Bacillota bacterium]
MNPCIAMDYIESCLKIKTKSGTVVPFRLNDAQRKLYAVAKRQQDAGKPVRLIILKARQLGFSTLTEGLIFHACATRRNVNALIVAHREDATANLFRMSKLFYDELPAPVKPMLRASNAQELVFENPSKLRSEREARPGLRSRIRCATAGGRGIGRSDTLQCVHLSEYAFWPDGADGKASTLAGILQAVPSLPGTMVVIESTANGFEDFKERWDAAVAGENDFEPVFFAWFENPDYSMPVVPGTEWTAEERELRDAYRLTDEQLQWRRWCIANNCGGSLDMFRQEYPASPGEAFLHSGTGVFDNEQIVLRLERLPEPAGRGEFTDGEWTESETGAITLYEMPEEGVPYVLGGDTAGEGSDYFTAIVIDNVTGRIAAKLRQKYSEPEYVRQICALGRFYNDALVAIETNFSTYPVMKLQEMEYPNQYSREREDTYTRQMRKSYGFRTDRQSRPRAIANLVEVFSSHPEWFTDRELLEEMLTFCYNEDHRPEALAGKHDDLVMGAAITYAVRHQQRMTVLMEPEKPREKLIDQMKRQKRAKRVWG